MNIVILCVGGYRVNGSNKRHLFANTEDAIKSAHTFCALNGVAPVGDDWRERLAAKETIQSQPAGYTFWLEEAPLNGVPLTTDAPLPVAAGDRPEPHDPLMQYVLMRRDVLDFQPGKAMAQATHAGNAMTALGMLKKDRALRDELLAWSEEAGGFGTCIVLETTAAEMRQAVSLAKLSGIHAGVVNDPTYPVWDGEKIQTLSVDTCAFVFGRKSVCAPVVGGFRLFR